MCAAIVQLHSCYICGMISVSDALACVLEGVVQGEGEVLPLSAASGRILAADILAPVAHPIFDQSAVDGYALRFADLAQFSGLRQVGEIQAGAASLLPLQPGECFRIFTGAPVPDSADTVVMQEYAEVRDGLVYFSDEKLKCGGNVRCQGEQIAAGAVALRAGHRLNAGGVGFLASLGIADVLVHSLPKVGLLITGNEFAQSPADLAGGLIFESNGQMLQDALQQEGIVAGFETVQDELPRMQRAVAQLAKDNEVLILTGGVSVGDYDFSRAALEAEGFEVVFHKVNQKPGKPLLFARRGDQVAFGLPGNPRAVLMCYHIYVLPHLRRRQMASHAGLFEAQLPLAHAKRKRPDGKTHFVTGQVQGGAINLLQLQQSHMLQSLATADVIVELPGAKSEYAAGDMLNVKFLSL